MTDKAQEEKQLARVWDRPRGWGYFSDVNNSVVGVWYICAAFAFMLFAGALALIIRTQLAVPENNLVSAETYNQLFTLHGTVMMFLFAVPIFEAVAILILPAMLGARSSIPIGPPQFFFISFIKFARSCSVGPQG